MREGRRRIKRVRDHLLEALERPFNFGTTGDIVLNFVNERCEGDAAGICWCISISKNCCQMAGLVCIGKEMAYFPFAFATAVAITAGVLNGLNSHST
jgi:hypothetical protein